MSLSAREHQLLQALVVLAIVYLAFQVFALGWVAVGQVADVVIIFVAAWALAYLLSPLVNSIDAETPLNRTFAVVVVYIAIALMLVLIGLLVIPPLVAQLNDLVTRGPEYGERATQLAADIQTALERIGIRVDLTEFYGTLPRRLGDLVRGLRGRHPRGGVRHGRRLLQRHPRPDHRVPHAQRRRLDVEALHARVVA